MSASAWKKTASKSLLLASIALPVVLPMLPTAMTTDDDGAQGHSSPYSSASCNWTSARILLFLFAALLFVSERIDRRRRVEAGARGRPLCVNPFQTGSIVDSLGLAALGHIWFLLISPRVPHTNRPDLMEIFAKSRDEANEEGYSASLVWLMHPMNPLSSAMIVVNDPSLVMELLSRKSFGKWKKGLGYRVAAPLVGHNSVLTAQDNDRWRHQRRILLAGFSKSVLLIAHKTIYQSVARLTARWYKNSTAGSTTQIEMLREMQKLSIEIIGKVAFSYDFKSCAAEDAPFANDFHLILKTLTTRARGSYIFAWAPTPENLRFNKAMANLDAIVTDIIEQKKVKQQEAIKDGAQEETATVRNKASNADVVDLLLSEDGTDDGMTSQQILDNIKTLFFAGHDTTASAIAWSFYLLSTHPEAERKLLAEFKSLDDMDLEEGGEQEYEELERLPYLNAVVKETLRLYPSASLSRQPVSKRGEQLGNIDVPYGDDVYVVPMLIHRDPRNWDQPDAFLPERWLDPKKLLDAKGRTPEQRGIYIPFSLGMRSCLGRMLALVELRTSLKAILQNYKFELAKNEDGVVEHPRPVVYLTICSNRMVMKVTRR